MATITPIESEAGDWTDRVVWSNLGNGDDGAPVSFLVAGDKTVQVTGTPGVGGTLIFEGSLEETPTNYFPLTDHNGNAISFTLAAGSEGELVAENVAHIRPRVTGGDVSTDFEATMIARRTV